MFAFTPLAGHSLRILFSLFKQD